MYASGCTYLESLAVLHRSGRVVNEKLSGDEDHEGGYGSRRGLGVKSCHLVLNLLKRKTLQTMVQNIAASNQSQVAVKSSFRQLTLSLVMMLACPIICSPSQVSMELSL